MRESSVRISEKIEKEYRSPLEKNKIENLHTCLTISASVYNYLESPNWKKCQTCLLLHVRKLEKENIKNSDDASEFETLWNKF